MRTSFTTAVVLSYLSVAPIRAGAPVDVYGRPLMEGTSRLSYREEAGRWFVRRGDGPWEPSPAPSSPVVTPVCGSSGATAAFGLGPYQTTKPGSWAEAVAIGDLTGDGRNDVVMTTTSYGDPANDYHVFLYPQLANGTLGPPAKYPYGASASRNGLAFADLNGDGLRDVVVGHGSGISVLLANGAGGLGAAIVTTGDAADTVAVSDVDLDGHADVVSLDWQGTATVRYGNGAGGFESSTSFSTNGGGYNDHEMEDVTGDGYEDLVVASTQGNPDFAAYPHDSIGAISGTAQTFNLGSINYVGLGDVNGDGLRDAVVSGSGNRPVDLHILTQDTSGQLTGPTTISSYDIPEPVVAQDIDGDGLEDAIVAHGGWLKLGVYLQRSSALQPEVLYDIPYASHYAPQGLAVGDINGDGCADVAIADYNNGLVTLLGMGCSSCSGRSLSPYTLPGATTGAAYSQAIIASGGVAPYTFSVISGFLPAGLSLSTSGLISGTPTTPSVSRFTVKAVDATGCPATKSYSIQTCGPLSLLPATLPNGSEGVPYSQTLTATGGAAPYAFLVTAGNLPAGLTLSAGGVIAGTPTLGAVYGFTATATDVVACAVSRSYALTITCPGCSSPGDIVTGSGLGQPNPNRVRVYTPSGTLTPVDFLAYGAGQWGVNVGGGDAAGATLDQIFTGPGPGPVFGPQVRGFASNGSPMAKINYYAYGTLRYGVNLALADVDDDGFGEIATGAGPGAVFGPHVRGFNYDNAAIAAMAKINFFAYGTLKFGVNTAGGGVDGDSWDELLTGPGPGTIFGPQVRGFNYDAATLAAIAKINFSAFTPAQYGANVAGGDVEADGFDEIACAQGPGSGASFRPRFRGFNYDAVSIVTAAGFDVTVNTATSYGGRVGLGDVTGDGTADLLAGEGRDVAALATVRPYAYAAATLTPLLSFDAFAGQRYGVNVAGADLGY